VSVDTSSLPPKQAAWHRIALLYAAGVLAAFQYAKIPFMLPGLLQQMPISPVQQAMVLSVIGALGAVAGTFAGAVCLRLGLKRTLLVGLAVGVVGSLLPLLHDSYGLLLLARVVESVAHMAIVVAVPTLILSLCAPAAQPKAMALWSCYFTLTFIIAAWLVPPVVQATGWRGVAWGHAALMVVVGALCLGGVKPDKVLAPSTGLTAGSLWASQWRLLSQLKLLAIPATFFGYTLLFVALVSVLPKWMATTPQALATWAMVLPLASLAGTLVAMTALNLGVQGYQLVRLSAVAMVLTGLVLLSLPQQSMGTQIAVVLVFLLLGTLPAGIVSSIPKLFASDDPDVALVNGGLVQFGNLGNFVGSPILAAMLVQLGWVSMGLYLIAGALITCIGLVFLRRLVLLAAQPGQAQVISD
jgi:MFS transporter, DHA1 family, inner membrane transport protein